MFFVQVRGKTILVLSDPGRVLLDLTCSPGAGAASFEEERGILQWLTAEMQEDIKTLTVPEEAKAPRAAKAGRGAVDPVMQEGLESLNAMEAVRTASWLPSRSTIKVTLNDNNAKEFRVLSSKKKGKPPPWSWTGHRPLRMQLRKHLAGHVPRASLFVRHRKGHSGLLCTSSKIVIIIIIIIIIIIVIVIVIIIIIVVIIITTSIVIIIIIVVVLIVIVITTIIRTEEKYMEGREGRGRQSNSCSIFALPFASMSVHFLRASLQFIWHRVCLLSIVPSSSQFLRK